MARTAGGSRPRRPWQRASDAERDEAVAGLREGFAAGQLSQDTFVHRMEEALAARERGQLDELFADLPARRHPAPPPPGLTAVGRRLAAALSDLRDAAATSARRMSAPLRPPLPPLKFPAGSQLRFTIGRDPGCDLVIPDMSVSRRHAGLQRCVRGWLLTDFGSTNGTRLNGWRVREPVQVGPGDQVSFGAVTFELHPGH
jgi:FHA domain/Domain of unknown function (DUF1707)